MKCSPQWAIMLSAGLLLTACGGGGGGGGGPSLAVGGPSGDPPVTPGQVRKQFADLGETGDRLRMTALRVWYGPSAGTTAGADCFQAARCTPATDEFSLIFTPETLSAIPRDAEIQGRGSRQGVPLVEYSGTSEAVLEFGGLQNPVSVDYQTLGGWMDYNFFTINLYEFERAGWQLWNGASVGVESGSNPVSGSAVWTGAMIGRSSDPDEVEKPGALVLGDSRLTFDFARNDIDVALTSIRSDNGESYPDITWDNIPTQNGVFEGSQGGYVTGAFYGPGHEEVGGIFERNQLIGAFGASRQ